MILLTLLKQIIAPILLFSVTLLVCEGILRIIPSPVQYATVHEIGSPDAVLGIEMISSTISIERQSCVEAKVTINSLGWRDRERTIGRVPGKKRIAVVGDSFVAGFQVADHETITRQLEELLGSDKVEVLNFGLSAIGTVQEEILYDHIVREYKPDIVLVGFYTNDLETNGELVGGESQFLTTRDDKGNLVKHPDTSSFANLRRFLRVHSAMFRLIKYVDRQVRQIASKSSDETDEQQVPLHLSLYTDPDDAKWQKGWQKTEQAFKRLRDELDPDTQLIVFAFPDILQIADDPRSLVKEQFNVDLPENTNFLIPHDRLFSFLTSEGFESIDLLPELLAFKKQAGLEYPYFYFMCDGHMNAVGLNLSAKIIAESLRPLLFGDGSAQ